MSLFPYITELNRLESYEAINQSLSNKFNSLPHRTKPKDGLQYAWNDKNLFIKRYLPDMAYDGQESLTKGSWVIYDLSKGLRTKKRFEFSHTPDGKTVLEDSHIPRDEWNEIRLIMSS